LDAFYHQADAWVEVLEAVDRRKASARRSPWIRASNVLEGLESGEITDTSMGCFVELSECSVCANRARDEGEYCTHIAQYKGQIVQHGGRQLAAYEINHGITFFEDSIITSTAENTLGGGGADPDAKILEVYANQKGPRWESCLVDHRPLTVRCLLPDDVERVRIRF
jgi:hypothetical protein